MKIRKRATLIEKGLFLTFGDFDIVELFLLNKKWLVKQRHKSYVSHKLISSPNVRMILKR